MPSFVDLRGKARFLLSFIATVRLQTLRCSSGQERVAGNAPARDWQPMVFWHSFPSEEFSSDRKPQQVPSNKKALSKSVDYVKSLPDVDPSRVVLMGHSRGGLLALMVGLERKDLKAIIVTAPASIPPYFSETVSRASSLGAPVLLLVEVSDEMGSLDAVNILDEALRKKGKEVRTIRYDRGGGHFLFAGGGDLYWWDDVRAFLREKTSTSTPN